MINPYTLYTSIHNLL